MIKLIATDLDGTLLTEKGTLTAETIKAVKELKKRGYLFTIATGRMNTMTNLFVKQLDIEIPIVACNGALIINQNTKEIIYKQCIDSKLATNLAEQYLKLDLDFLFYTIDQQQNVKIFHRNNSRRLNLHKYYNKLCSYNEIATLDFASIEECWEEYGNLENFLQKTGHEVLKFFVKHEDINKVKEAYAVTENLGELSIVQSWNGSFDVMAAEITKASGLKILVDYLGLKLEEVASFGDQFNDKEMLDVSGLSYAMKNGEYQNYCDADYIADTNRVEGLSRTLNQDFSKTLKI